MVKPDAYSAAQELGAAIDRAAAAEQEVHELKIELENAHGTINRLSMQLAEERQRWSAPICDGNDKLRRLRERVVARKWDRTWVTEEIDRLLSDSQPAAADVREELLEALHRAFDVFSGLVQGNSLSRDYLLSIVDQTWTVIRASRAAIAKAREGVR